jgi:L-ribulose-5-phosphate 3-epimerase
MRTALFTKVFSERDLREACAFAADIGYDGVELMGRDPHFSVETTDSEARALKDHLNDLDLDVPCIASYTGNYVGKSDAECEDQLAKLERFCELATILGVDLVRHGPGGPSSYLASEDHYEEGARWLRQAADRAADYGVDLAVEIHSNTIIESADDAVHLLELIDRDNVGAIHDAGNMYISAENHGPESIETLGNWLRHVHMKDEQRVEDTDSPAGFEQETRRGRECFEAMLLGEGDTDPGAVCEALVAAGYDGYVTDECHVPPTDDRDDIDIAEHEYTELKRLGSWEG